MKFGTRFRYIWVLGTQNWVGDGPPESLGVLQFLRITMTHWLLSLVSCLFVTPVLGVFLESYKDAKETYDYVIIGGGTAGLTVADRLSESGKRSVLVVEYGYLGKSEP